ncbi:MAG: FixH family protein [Anaerolineae bacterium]|nr:FixH family protein [Chloroflexota bacterium]MBN8635333.1 FixH family protein [Anaerolineae bacterium]
MRRMIIAVVAVIVVVAVGIGTYLVVRGSQEEVLMDDQIHIQLSSKPFPLIVGVNTLVLRVVKNGEPISGASIEVEANRTMQGQIPLYGRATEDQEGVYEIPMVWPATDRWTIDVSAWVGDELIRDEFTAFVFAVLEENMSPRETYASNTAIEAAQVAHPEEFWIVIPQGTAAQIREGHGDDVMPTEIRLSVNGQNTLVLKNNDLADHTIGPFFVRAGETLRQTFTTPQVFEGVCSVRHDSVVRIIVE